MNLLKLPDVASDLGISPATVRHHLRAMKEVKHGRDWLLTPQLVSRLKRYIATARKAKGFQPGNQLAAKESP